MTKREDCAADSQNALRDIPLGGVLSDLGKLRIVLHFVTTSGTPIYKLQRLTWFGWYRTIADNQDYEALTRCIIGLRGWTTPSVPDGNEKALPPLIPKDQ